MPPPDRLLLVLIGLACADASTAQPIHRCVDPQGVRVFVDRPCEFLGLRATAAPAASAERRQSDNAAAALPAPEIDTGPVKAAAGCPGPDAETLRDAVREALAAKQVNALTGMYYWAGAGRHAGNAVIDRFQRLVGAAPQSVELVRAADADDWLWAGLPPPDAPPPPELVIGMTPFDEPPLARFRLRSQAGCLWLSER